MILEDPDDLLTTLLHHIDFTNGEKYRLFDVP